jgi:hypothetical protein
MPLLKPSRFTFDVTGEQVAVPRAGVHLLPEAGVQDDDVDVAELVTYVCGGGVHAGAVRHVGLGHRHPARGHLLQLVPPARRDGDLGATRDQLVRQGCADAARGADDPDHCAFEGRHAARRVIRSWLTSR